MTASFDPFSVPECPHADFLRRVSRIYLHTHPYQLLASGPSAADYEGLQQLGQTSSWVLERGLLTRFWAGGA